METFSALLALLVGNSPVTDESPSQRPVTQTFGVFFDLLPNKRLSKQSWRWWFEMPLLLLYDVIVMQFSKLMSIQFHEVLMYVQHIFRSILMVFLAAVFHLFSANSSPEAMLAYRQVDPYHFHWGKCIWKCRVWNGGRFTRASICICRLYYKTIQLCTGRNEAIVWIVMNQWGPTHLFKTHWPLENFNEIIDM